MSADSNKERQRKFKEKMYDAGFKRIYFWVKKEKAEKGKKIGKEAFIKKAIQMAAKIDPDEQSKMFGLIIKILEGKKEALKLREKGKDAGGEGRG